MPLSSAALQLQRLLNSLPLPDERISEAEKLIKECSEADLAQLGLGPPPRPVVPRSLIDGGKGGGDGKPSGGPQQRLHTVQQVINSLQYNHTPGYYYNVSKSRPFSRIMDTAREALRVALPIKCLEAVFLGALMTAGWQDLDRLPLAFKSTVQGQTYRHIVLAVFHAPSRTWGALGLSRRPELMDKNLEYESLADLVSEYKSSYERWWHTLARVYVGLPLEHDTYYAGPVCWRYLTLSLTGRKSWMAHRVALDKFAGQARRLAAKFRALGGKPTSETSLGAADLNPAVSIGMVLTTTAVASSLYAGSAVGRCAKSASPARRRPTLPPPPPPPPPPPLTTTLTRRPGTPSRLQASPRPPPKTATRLPPQGSSVTVAAALTATATTTAAPTNAGAQGVSGSGKSPSGAAAIHSTAFPASVFYGTGGHTEINRLSAAANDIDSGNVAASATLTPPSFVLEVVNGDGSGADAVERIAELALDSQPSSIRARGFRTQPHRSSDPGSGAVLAVAAVAAPQERRRSGRVQARILRQQLKAEEQSGEVNAGREGSTAVLRCEEGEEEDEDEDSDSDEGDYMSDEGS
ncbi:hypothetical protein VaNZ11_000991 [Volvox africanus]|uniref:Uncharacterized protein n=1 Tax=Volvox africanus TaxID=51714 RepID=A0ABQ5RP19_9CHLO|nr:hypothetical protein VaNZ11_000991 [Volvox africanus]